jgi:hypothetical protein
MAEDPHQDVMASAMMTVVAEAEDTVDVTMIVAMADVVMTVIVDTAEIVMTTLPVESTATLAMTATAEEETTVVEEVVADMVVDVTMREATVALPEKLLHQPLLMVIQHLAQRDANHTEVVSALLVKFRTISTSTTRALDLRLSLMQVHRHLCISSHLSSHHGPKLRATGNTKSGVYNFGRYERTFESVDAFQRIARVFFLLCNRFSSARKFGQSVGHRINLI